MSKKRSSKYRYWAQKHSCVCGALISPQAMFCRRCAAKQRQVRPRESYCLVCGVLVTPGAKHCKAHAYHLPGRSSAGNFQGQFYHCEAMGKAVWLRSSWEAAFARWLDRQGFTWSYESRRFRLGGMTYTPDFWVEELRTYIEVKGRFLPLAREKVKLFQELYPETGLIVLERDGLRRLGVNV